MINKHAAIKDLQIATNIAFGNIDVQPEAANYWTGYYDAMSDILNILEEEVWEK